MTPNYRHNKSGQWPNSFWPSALLGKRRDLLLLAGIAVLAVWNVMLLTQDGARANKVRIPAGQPLTGAGMWVWYVPSSLSGKNKMISDLHKSGIKTVFVKSGDGTHVWKQFSQGLVEQLQLAGIHVCAWHYVYGDKPVQEALVSAYAYQQGAECFVVDAEAEYANKSKQAAAYMTELRKRTSIKWLVGLSSFPYTRYHEDFPYAAFLAPGRASVNLPQMYWHEIGRSPERIVADTYKDNLRFGRPVYPIGQTWQNPRPQEIQRFQAAVQKAGARGWSWWDWGSTNQQSWQALGRR